MQRTFGRSVCVCLSETQRCGETFEPGHGDINVLVITKTKLGHKKEIKDGSELIRDTIKKKKTDRLDGERGHTHTSVVQTT